VRGASTLLDVYIALVPAFTHRDPQRRVPLEQHAASAVQRVDAADMYPSLDAPARVGRKDDGSGFVRSVHSLRFCASPRALAIAQ